MNGGPSTPASVSSVVGSCQQVHYQTGSAPIRPKSSSSLHSSIGTVSLLMLPYQSATDPMTRLRNGSRISRRNAGASCSIAWIRTGSPSAHRHSRRRCRSAWLAARSSGEHATFAMRYRHAITRYHAISRDITRYQIFVVAVSDKKAPEGAFLRDSLTGLKIVRHTKGDCFGVITGKRGTAIASCLAAADKFVTDIVSGGKTVATRTQGEMRPVRIDQA